tara:strand:+ start:143 stop:271 length:129 start_codon:yes stop_codon:yes gene_type:complete
VGELMNVNTFTSIVSGLVVNGGVYGAGTYTHASEAWMIGSTA